MARTLKELAEEAMQVQDACNLTAVVKGMDRAIADLREHGILGTDEIRRHHVTRLWAAKIADLCNFSLTDTGCNTFTDCYQLCIIAAKGEN